MEALEGTEADFYHGYLWHQFDFRPIEEQRRATVFCEAYDVSMDHVGSLQFQL